MTALRIAFAGTPEFAVPALQALLGSRHEVVGVLTRPDRPRGRGQRVTASAIKEVAQSRGLAVAQPETLRGEAGPRQLTAWNPDVLVVVAYGLILPAAVLTLPRLGCVNIHASLLPRWRGAAPIQRAILAGDAETGVTIMLMDVGLDTGPTLLQRSIPIATDDTGGALHDRLAVLGADSLLEALEGFAAGKLCPQPQSQDGASYAAKLDKKEALIDWQRRALDIERQVRAFNPWPIAETRFDGEPLRILSARAVSPDTRAPSILPPGPLPGTIAALTPDALVVQCGRDTLAVMTLQRPGRRPVSASDFAHTRTLVGRRFG